MNAHVQVSMEVTLTHKPYELICLLGGIETWKRAALKGSTQQMLSHRCVAVSFISARRDKVHSFGHFPATSPHHLPPPPLLPSIPGISEPLTNTSMDERVLPLNPIPPPW